MKIVSSIFSAIAKAFDWRNQEGVVYIRDSREVDDGVEITLPTEFAKAVRRVHHPDPPTYRDNTQNGK